ncbi:MAG: hypothetical protein HUU37_05385 [Bdellovibrionales bacterium]|nr:hypothetical protein [Bdellovibrionales bacterium]
MEGTKRYAAVLSLTEVGLGSMLHSFHVPLAGHALSLNQGAILTFALKRAPSWRHAVEGSAAISMAAAGMKTFSPAGKRLTPMLGITVQGLLYALGVSLGGRGLAGVLLGMALLSVWAFAQSVLLAWIIFGKELFLSIRDLWLNVAEKLGVPTEWGVWLLVLAVGSKLTCALVVGMMSWVAAPEREERYIAGLTERITRGMKKMVAPDPGGGAGDGAALALRDLLRPWFVASFAVSVGCFAAFRGGDAEAVIVYGGRVLFLGWLAFWAMRWGAARWRIWGFR